MLSTDGFVAIDFETNPVPFFDKKGRGRLNSFGHPRNASPILMSWSDGVCASHTDNFSSQTVLNCDLPLIFHNATFDIQVGLKSGLFAKSVTNGEREVHCTATMASLLRNDLPNGLKDLAQLILGEKEIVRYSDALALGTEGFERYAENDALYTARIYPILKERLLRSGQWDLYQKIELPFLFVNLECQQNGLLIDRKALLEQRLRLCEEVTQTKTCLSDYPINWNSSKQVQELVFGEWNLPLVYHKGRVSVDRQSLKKLSFDSRIAKLLRLRSAESRVRQLDQISKFIDPNTGAIHPYIHTLGADTGRCTSSKPNLQNINKDSELRSLFISRPRYRLVVLDFSQIEPRVLAHFLKDSPFSKLFFDDEDFYSKLARDVFAGTNATIPARDIAKQAVLATLYGMGERLLAEQLKTSKAEAAHFLEKFYTAYPEVTAFRDNQIRISRKCGYAEGLFNRRRYISGLEHSEEYERFRAERQVLNAIVQGSAATLFKYKLVRLRQALPESTRFLLHVHDEVILEAPESDAEPVYSKATQVLEAPESWFSIPIKVEGGIGQSWSEAKSNFKKYERRS